MTLSRLPGPVPPRRRAFTSVQRPSSAKARGGEPKGTDLLKAVTQTLRWMQEIDPPSASLIYTIYEYWSLELGILLFGYSQGSGY